MKVVIVLGLMIFVVNAMNHTHPHEINEQEWILFKVCMNNILKYIFNNYKMH